VASSLAGRQGHTEPSRPLLSAPEVASLRQEIKRCGGQFRADEQGQPLAIDLAHARVSADQAAFDAVLCCLHLKELRLRAQQLPPAQFARLQQLQHLESLSLQDCDVTDDSLKTILSGLVKLRQLTLANLPHVTGESLVALKDLPRLSHLALIRLEIDTDVVATLTTAPELQSLDLRFCTGWDQEHVAMLAEAPRLTALKLGGPTIDHGTLRSLGGFQNLESLGIEDAPIDQAGLQILASSPTLVERLDSLAFARCFGLDDAALHHLADFPRLRSLVLRDAPVSGQFLTALPHPAQIERLGLNQTFLVDEAFAAIAAFPNLKRLELASNPLNAQAIAAISTLSQLEYLDVTACDLDDTLIQPLARLGALKTLLVDENPRLTETAIKQLLRR
jgi:hypothetical protein